MVYSTRANSISHERLFGPGELAAGAAALALGAPVALAAFVVVAGARTDARRQVRPGIGDLAVVVQRVALALVVLAVAGGDLRGLLGGAGAAIVVVVTARVVEHQRAGGRAWGTLATRTILVGSEDGLRKIGQLLAAHPEHGIHPVATATPDGSQPTVLPGGRVDDLLQLVDAHLADHVLVASDEHADAVAAAIGRERPYGLRVSVLPPMAELLTAGAQVIDLRGLPLVTLAGRRAPQGTSWAAKRVCDYVAAAVGLAVLAPFFMIVAIAVRVDSPGPVFFRQERVGRNGRTFRMWKFRTMVAGAEHQLADLRAANEAVGPFFKIEHDPRLTRVGRLLRRVSVDELPQLLNVLQGDMSLVGPRPVLPSELEAAPQLLRWRLPILPGITGPWQVAGRSWLPVDEGVRMDLAYVEHWGLRTDLLVLARTAKVALRNDRRPPCIADPTNVRLRPERYAGVVAGGVPAPSGPVAEVTAIVVTHESEGEIAACLDSLVAAMREVDLEIIVVDNVSSDATVGIVARYPSVKLIRKSARGGFAENCNIGALAASGRHILLFNPDARIRPGALPALLERLESRPDIGVVGPRLVYPDGRPQAAARRYPTVGATLIRRSPLRLVLGRSGAERAHLAPADTRVEQDVDWMLGAAVLVRGEAFRQLDGLDDGYRLYCEDIDLCWRLQARGWRVRYMPSIVAEHGLAETTRKQFLTVRTWWHLRSMVRFVRLHGLPKPVLPPSSLPPSRPGPVDVYIDLRSQPPLMQSTLED